MYPEFVSQNLKRNGECICKVSLGINATFPSGYHSIISSTNKNNVFFTNNDFELIPLITYLCIR